MCLAIYKPAGITIPKIHLFNGFQSNWSVECGSGFSWNVNGELHVVKGILAFDNFYEQYKAVEQHPMLVHFRLATHRPVNQENCHPFTMCDNQFALIHNGVFDIEIKNKNLSDTGNFCEQVMEPCIQCGKYKNKKLMKRIMGWNMACLMGSNGEVIIYNEELGNWDNNVWYSNRAYRSVGTIACEDY